jgi:hypothetical protein
VTAAGVGSSARAKIASWALVSKRATQGASKTAAGAAADEGEDAGDCSDSDSDGGFAKQIQARLLGHKNKCAAKAAKCDSDCGSGSEKNEMSDSEMSDGDKSAEEEGGGNDGADVTAVCLDLKGEQMMILKTIYYRLICDACRCMLK